jgi:hypothetical protein
MSDIEQQMIYNFLCDNIRPKCRHCCYWKNGISYFIKYLDLGIKSENLLDKPETI